MAEPDLLEVPRMRAAWVPLVICVVLLGVGLVWGGTQIVRAAGGDGCQPVRDPLTITTVMSRLDPRDAGKRAAMLLLPRLVGALQVDDPHAPGVRLVAGYVRGEQWPVLGPGVWEVRDPPGGHHEAVQVFARNAVAQALAPQITSFPSSAGGRDQISRVLRCVLAGRSPET